MDWAKLIKDRARISGVLRVEELSRELGLSEAAIRNSLRRQETRGLVEHVGNKVFINRLANGFSGRELINILRPEAYLSLETVLRESGVSTQSPRVLTCVTPERSGAFRARSLAIVFRRISRKLFWGFHEERTLYGKYNAADPEKALLDWVYLGRQTGSTIHTDELDLHRLDQSKLVRYASKFPRPVTRQILEAIALRKAG
jgi:predicted transcriptional regulator of viral defense system